MEIEHRIEQTVEIITSLVKAVSPNMRLSRMATIIACTNEVKKHGDRLFWRFNQAQKILPSGGEKAIARRDYAEAVKNLEALDAIYPFGPHAQQAGHLIYYMIDRNRYKQCYRGLFFHG